MRLHSEFIRLSLSFDAVRLAAEVAEFAESAWRSHPDGTSISLVVIEGDAENDSVKGAMRPTPHLGVCPYLRQVLASLRAPIGRTRLIRIDGNARGRRPWDGTYYSLQRSRICIPIATDPAVRFVSGVSSIHMAAGEAWAFDAWRAHEVVNPTSAPCIHLVSDTVGSPELTSLLERQESRFVPFDETAEPHLEFEVRTLPVVMAPHEQARLIQLLDIGDPEFLGEVNRFADEWRGVWHLHGERPSGWRQYRALLERFDGALSRFQGTAFGNGLDAVEVLRQAFVGAALNPDLAPRGAPEVRVGRRIDRPIFIVAAPRAGSTLLFDAMAQSPTVFTPGRVSHAIIEGIDALHPAQRGWESNRLTAADATPLLASVIETRFLAELRARDGSRRLAPGVRMLDDTPGNALRIPFLQALFPDAFFVYLYRDARATVSSMIDAWESGRFVTYPSLPGWTGRPWSLILVPGWRDLNGRPIEEIVAQQWATTTSVLLDDLEALPSESWSVTSYDALLADPRKELERLSAFVGIEWDHRLAAALPPHTLGAADEWLRNGQRIESIAGRIAPVAERAREIFARPPAQRLRVPKEAFPDLQSEDPAPFRSVHTSTFTDVLETLRVSVVASTYQSGRVVLLRRDGDATNTHFVAFERPMGIAVNSRRLSLGTAGQVWDYRNSPVLTARLEPAGKHDACFVPRNVHVTGDIAVHEMAYDSGGTLWVVNTRFSTLCTLDSDHSFVPRWRPPFVTESLPEDRCHLNGLAIIEGRPRVVSVLGETNREQGWRENKASGGALIDLDSGMTIVRGLSMPHSPRWHAGKLWVLESGRGSLMSVDTRVGRVETVALLPGFTRGLAFAGDYAFVGLSQVRESVFDGIPLSKRIRLDERSCGIWVVDIRTGNIVAFLKFEELVQEIFDVQLLHGIEFPEMLEPASPLVMTHYEVPASTGLPKQ